MIKPLPRGCSRRSQLKVVLTLPAQSRAPAAGLSGPKPHTCTPHPLPSPKSSLTSVPPSEALFSSLPQPRSSTMLFLLLHFLISSQFAPTQLPPPEIPKVSESEVTQSCLTVCNPHGLQPTRLLRPWVFPGKSTRVGCRFLLQGIFPTQGWNSGLPHCKQMLLPFYHLRHQGTNP